MVFGHSILAARDTDNSKPSLVPFITMQMLGWFAAMIILFTAWLSKNIRRQTHWYSFWISWIISCISYLLLFFGGQLNHESPNSSLCLIQAAAIYAAPPLTACTTLGLVVHLWYSIRTNVLKVPPLEVHDHFRTVFFIAFPYFVWAAVFLGDLGVGLRYQNLVEKSSGKSYCDLGNPVPGKITATIVAIVSIATITVEAMIVTTLRRSWREYTCNSRDSFATVIRVIGFTLFGVLAITLSFAYLSTTKHGVVPAVMMSLMPLAAAAIFGSQRDLIHVWMFWRQSNSTSYTPMSSPTPKLSAESIVVEPRASLERDTFYDRR